MPDAKVLKFPSSEGPIISEEEPSSFYSSRRRSCALVNTPAPCVNKAVFHIRSLQSKLEQWSQQTDNAQHETAHENSHRSIWKCDSKCKNTEGQTDLCVEGMELSIQDL
ncbi:hypothetical protein DNTS_005826 [Danionella cerebrum]|uniref:Uncharacterized protein n=1 Tax=Danionella cerebrum TaxID=2873325 RepID=A0A553QJU4_9TELE|nr:hypothetical protein DNTS_005826 [Danionella translucida]